MSNEGSPALVLAPVLHQTGRVRRGAKVGWRASDSIAWEGLPQAR